MHKIIAFSLLFASFSSYAVICKTVGPDGEVTYSDVPEEECQNRVRLPQSSTYEPVPVGGAGTGEPGATGEAAEFTGYVSARITQPANNGTVRSEEGRVAVSLEVEPGLQPGHSVRWILDGIQIQPSFDAPSAVLTGVDRGTHSLSAQVLDERGRVVRSTATVRFTLRKTSILDGEGGDSATPPPPSYESGGFKAKVPDDPPYPSDEPAENTFDTDPRVPGESPEYQGTDTPKDFYSNTPPPISTTPGQTNPAFKPNFSVQ